MVNATRPTLLVASDLARELKGNVIFRHVNLELKAGAFAHLRCVVCCMRVLHLVVLRPSDGLRSSSREAAMIA
eukprot:6961291-Pyramimonas_sp.AAC.1